MHVCVRKGQDLSGPYSATCAICCTVPFWSPLGQSLTFDEARGSLMGRHGSRLLPSSNGPMTHEPVPHDRMNTRADDPLLPRDRSHLRLFTSRS
jgi:hypothetical protein